MVRENNPTRAIFLILIVYLLFAMVDTVTKNVANQLPPVQAVWARYLVQSFLMIAVFAPRHGKAILRTNRPLMNVMRGMVAVGSSMGFIYAAAHLPLPVTTAIQFVNPLLVCLLAAIFLGEKVGIRRLIAIIFGMSGVLIVLRPHGAVDAIGLIGAAVTVVSLSVFAVMTRALAGGTPAYVQQTFSSFVPLILLAAPAYLAWSGDVDWWTYGQIVAMGAFAWAGYYLLVVAHQYAPAVTLAPYVYTMLLWTSLFSWLFFDQPPDGWVILGAVLIISSGVYIWHRERYLAETAQ